MKVSEQEFPDIQYYTTTTFDILLQNCEQTVALYQGWSVVATNVLARCVQISCPHMNTEVC